MNEKTIQNWLDLAQYDFDTAKAMLKSKRYLYLAFACHQTIEKMLNALYVIEIGATPPYTHNLIKLADGLKIFSKLSKESQKFIEDMNSYYIQTRYTEDIAKITESLTKEKSKAIYNETKALYVWLNKQM